MFVTTNSNVNKTRKENCRLLSEFDTFLDTRTIPWVLEQLTVLQSKCCSIIPFFFMKRWKWEELSYSFFLKKSVRQLAFLRFILFTYSIIVVIVSVFVHNTGTVYISPKQHDHVQISPFFMKLYNLEEWNEYYVFKKRVSYRWHFLIFKNLFTPIFFGLFQYLHNFGTVYFSPKQHDHVQSVLFFMKLWKMKRMKLICFQKASGSWHSYDLGGLRVFYYVFTEFRIVLSFENVQCRIYAESHHWF